jgi:hypothetical protein
MQLPRLLPRAGGAGKAGKQLFDLFESCLSDLPTGEAGGGALRRRTAAAAAAELRLLAERLLLQQAEEGAGLADAAQQGFTLGRLAQLLQAALASPPPPASVQGSGADGIGDGAGGEGWDGALLRQVLWCSAALQALTVGRSSVTKAAARQLERLLQERWAVPAVPGEDGPHGGDEASGGGSGGGGGGGAAVDAAAAAEARLQVARAAVQLLESLQAPADAACAAPAEAAAARARWLQHLCGPLLARLCACVCPERREPMYMLQLIKAPSQTGETRAHAWPRPPQGLSTLGDAGCHACRGAPPQLRCSFDLPHTFDLRGGISVLMKLLYMLPPTMSGHPTTQHNAPLRAANPAAQTSSRAASAAAASWPRRTWAGPSCGTSRISSAAASIWRVSRPPRITALETTINGGPAAGPPAALACVLSRAACGAATRR